MKLPTFHIDWPNHIIGFFSALFGILIAFELDEWRNERNQAEQARIAFETLKGEVQINQTALHENINNNLQHIHVLQGLLPKLDEKLRFTGTKAEVDVINSNFGELISIDVSGDTNQGRPAVTIEMGDINVPSLQTSGWESAKATGALNLMGYEKVLSLSFLYGDSRINDELNEIRTLWRTADNITTKLELTNLLNEMEKSHQSLDREMLHYDKFVNMLSAME